MKLIATILAIITLLLSIQPVLTQKSRASKTQANRTEKCCFNEEDVCKSSNETKPQKDKQNKCCDNGFCNPFEVCACCFFISNESPLVYLSDFLPFAQREKVILTNDKILSLYVQNFWHPPKLFHITKFLETILQFNRIIK